MSSSWNSTFCGSKKQSDNSPSLDRLIPNNGYVKKNVRVISKKANTMKSNGTLNDLVNLTRWLEKELDTL